jgi:phosphoglycolate phosphatase-like HAD superfamily hydrolase
MPEVRPDTHGRTDLEIMRNLFTENGVDAENFTPEEVFAALVVALDGQRGLLADRGYALPGAAEVLRRARSQPDVLQSVLTGNVPENARVKLATFDLDQYLDLEIGGYGTDSIIRSKLVSAARQKAERKYGHEFDTRTTILVGDTVRDVVAAREGGALIIGVATGTHNSADLAAAGADAVIESLAEPDDFFRALNDLIQCAS